MNKNRLCVVLLLSSVLVSACSPVRQYDLTPRATGLERQQDVSEESSENTAQPSDTTPERTSSNLPRPPSSSGLGVALNYGEEVALEGPPIAINVASLPLPEFVHEVFGNQLGLSYHLDPKLESKKDLVTLHIEEPLPPQDLYRTARDVLAAYGVGLIYDQSLLKIQYSPSGSSTEPPLLISGEALPSVPVTHRPVFFLMDLKVVQAQRAVGWLSQAFEGQKAKFSSDPERNAVWLRGSLDVVKQAAEVVKLVDQPLMRGHYSMRVEPRYLGADKLSKHLSEMLNAQGYHAVVGKPGAVSIFTIEETNSIIVFAADKALLPFIKEWVLELDQPLKQTKGDSVFYYEVKNTSAEAIAETLNSLRGGGGLGAGAAADSAGTATTKSGASTSSRGELVVDLGRNALLFYGSNTEWVTMLPAIERLDRKPLQVLIEVIIAEVALRDSFEFGVDWAINDPGSNLFGGIAEKSVQIAGGVLNYYPVSSSGSTRAILNMLATDNQVNILQTPRLLVRSGEQAAITVGDEVPIVVGSQTSPEGGGITQEVQYRSTGNNLVVKPVVYAGGAIDLTISQEVSDAVGGTDSGNPTISTRRVSTALSIHDGGSVLVGGLIRTKDEEVESKVPFFSSIPWLGKAFFTNTTLRTERTELMILIAPYVVSNNADAEAVTKAFKEQLTLIPESDSD